MKIAVVSYSFTGNNDRLASSIASTLKAAHISITESKKRTMSTIIWDMLFNRKPKVSPAADQLKGYDLVILVGPVWMSQVATPFRAYLKYLRDTPAPYAFISISGGADGANLKLADDLKKRTGRAPAALIDMGIVDLLPKEPKPTRETTSAYQLSDTDVRNLTARAVQVLKEKYKMEMAWTSKEVY